MEKVNIPLIASFYEEAGYVRGTAQGVQELKAYLKSHPWQEVVAAESLGPSFKEIDPQKRQDHVGAFSAALYRTIRDVMKTARGPHMVIGGDHSLLVGHAHAVADNFQDPDICLVFIDAHADIHTPESSSSKAPHGMGLRRILEAGLPDFFPMKDIRPEIKPAIRPENLFMFGLRSYEPSEMAFIERSNIFCLKAEEAEDPRCLEAGLQTMKERIGSRRVLLSLDVDSLDDRLFPAVSSFWAGRGQNKGLSLETVLRITKAAFYHTVVGVDISEYNPATDTSDRRSWYCLQKIVNIFIEYLAKA